MHRPNLIITPQVDEKVAPLYRLRAGGTDSGARIKTNQHGNSFPFKGEMLSVVSNGTDYLEAEHMPIGILAAGRCLLLTYLGLRAIGTEPWAVYQYEPMHLIYESGAISVSNPAGARIPFGLQYEDEESKERYDPSLVWEYAQADGYRRVRILLTADAASYAYLKLHYTGVDRVKRVEYINLKPIVSFQDVIDDSNSIPQPTRKRVTSPYLFGTIDIVTNEYAVFAIPDPLRQMEISLPTLNIDDGPWEPILNSGWRYDNYQWLVATPQPITVYAPDMVMGDGLIVQGTRLGSREVGVEDYVVGFTAVKDASSFTHTIGGITVTSNGGAVTVLGVHSRSGRIMLDRFIPHGADVVVTINAELDRVKLYPIDMNLAGKAPEEIIAGSRVNIWVDPNESDPTFSMFYSYSHQKETNNITPIGELEGTIPLTDQQLVFSLEWIPYSPESVEWIDARRGGGYDIDVSNRFETLGIVDKGTYDGVPVPGPVVVVRVPESALVRIASGFKPGRKGLGPGDLRTLAIDRLNEELGRYLASGTALMLVDEELRPLSLNARLVQTGEGHA